MVVVIIGLLAAFVVPNFIHTGEGVRIDLTRAAITGNGPIPSALKTYQMHMGKFPTTEEGLKALVEPPSDEEAAKKWRGPYLEASGLKDQWGNDYVYRYPGQYNKDGYDLYSYGPDGRQGSDDDIINWSQDN